MKKIAVVAFIIVFFMLLFSSCALQDLLGGASRTTKVKVTLTPETPSYIGQTLKVRVTTTPKKDLAYIRLTTKNFVTGEERAYTQEDASSHEFSIKLNSSQFGFFVETPGKTRSNGKEVWWPSKEAYIEIEDYTPPTVTVNLSRVSETSNDFAVTVVADESESAVSRRWVTINGTEYNLEGQRDSTVLTLPIGTHVIRGYAQNRYGYTGSSSNKYMEVTPPRSNTPANISWNHPKQLTPFADEIVTLSAQITDNISYIKRIELQTQSGNKKTYNFDPMVQTYSLRYNLKATKSEKVTVTVTNGNNIISPDSVDLSIINHRAPKVTLTGPTGSFPIDESKTYTMTIEAYDEALIENAWFLVNNTTVSAFQGIAEDTLTKTLTYNVLKGKKYLKAIAKDDRGATGQSDEIEVVGYQEDKTPPRIQLYVPNVAYTNVQTDLSFLVQDSDSDLAGIPSLSILEEGLTLNPLTYDNAFYFSKWTPEATGTRTVQVKAADTAGNQATATASIIVKDPTGIVRPTLGALSAYPNSLMLGSTVSLVLSVTPPVQNPGGITPVVEIAVTAPNGGTPYKINNVTGTGNIYSGTYRPVAAGVHTAVAFIQWGEDQYTKSCTFRVDSPTPTMVFTVEPPETYIGNAVTLKLSPDTANPNASITILEISVEDEALSWVKTFGSGGSVIYVATKSTLDMNPGTKMARAKIRDSFGNEIVSTATFLLRAPELRIAGYKYTTDSGQPLNAYDPTSFEVYMGNHVPASIPISGEIAITRTGASGQRASIETYPLQRASSNAYTFITSEKWIPKESGTYGLTIRLSGIIGSQATETKLATQVSVAAAQLNIGLSATPVEIDKIRTGERVSLVFTVTGATQVDPIRSFSYGIRSGTAVHQTETALTPSGTHTYTHTPPAFSIAGTYTIVATAVTVSGNSKVLSRTIEVKVPSITISIESSPVIDRITVGSPVVLRFSVDGVPATDRISSFAYAIWKGNAIYKDVVYFNAQRATAYTDDIAPFVDEATYTIVATVTTAGLSVVSNSRGFAVLSAEIRKKTFTLEGNPNQLFIGAPLFFILELENPKNLTALSVRMYVTDENGNPIPGIGPINAASANNKTYKNVEPFYISAPGTITVYASVTLMQVPQIDLPAMRSDSDYIIPPSTVGIYLDESKQYLAGYEGSLRVTVTMPQGMNIQSPRVVLANASAGEIDPTPYASDSSGNTVKYYTFKFTPTLPGSPVVDISIYDASDFSLLNPLTTRRATLSVIEFRPQVRIVGTTDGESRFIQVKDPEIRMELTQIPEFFNGTYRFEARLNGNPTKTFPVTTSSASVTASFDAAFLYNLSGTDAATVLALVTAIGNQTFRATGSANFDIDYPSISNPYFPDYVTNENYTAYQECQMIGRFNNIDNALKLLAVDLYLSDGTATKTYNGNLDLSGSTVQATATFNKVVFESTVPHSGYFAVYSANNNPRRLLSISPVSTFTVANTGSYVDIIYPHKDEEVFVGILLKPVVRLTNIPGVISVRVTILDSTDATIVQNGRTQEATPGYWVLSEIDAKKLTKSGNYKVLAKVESSILGLQSAENTFVAIDGFIRIDVVARKTGGTLIFPTEYLEFETSMSFENPYASPTEFASLSHAAGGGEVPVEFIGRTIGVNGELKNYLSRWRKSVNTTLDATSYTFTLTAEYGLSENSKAINFSVLPIVATPTFSKSHGTIQEGDIIEGYITFLLPREATSTIIPFIAGNVTFENATPNGRETTLIATDTGYAEYRITSKAIPRTAGTLRVTYSTQLEEQLYRLEESYIVTSAP